MLQNVSQRTQKPLKQNVHKPRTQTKLNFEFREIQNLFYLRKLRTDLSA